VAQLDPNVILGIKPVSLGDMMEKRQLAAQRAQAMQIQQREQAIREQEFEMRQRQEAREVELHGPTLAAAQARAAKDKADADTVVEGRARQARIQATWQQEQEADNQARAEGQDPNEVPIHQRVSARLRESGHPEDAEDFDYQMNKTFQQRAETELAQTKSQVAAHQAIANGLNQATTPEGWAILKGQVAAMAKTNPAFERENEMLGDHFDPGRVASLAAMARTPAEDAEIKLRNAQLNSLSWHDAMDGNFDPNSPFYTKDPAGYAKQQQDQAAYLKGQADRDEKAFAMRTASAAAYLGAGKNPQDYANGIATLEHNGYPANVLQPFKDRKYDPAWLQHLSEDPATMKRLQIEQQNANTNASRMNEQTLDKLVADFYRDYNDYRSTALKNQLSPAEIKQIDEGRKHPDGSWDPATLPGGRVITGSAADANTPVMEIDDWATATRRTDPRKYRQVPSNVPGTPGAGGAPRRIFGEGVKVDGLNLTGITGADGQLINGNGTATYDTPEARDKALKLYGYPELIPKKEAPAAKPAPTTKPTALNQPGAAVTTDAVDRTPPGMSPATNDAVDRASPTDPDQDRPWWQTYSARNEDENFDNPNHDEDV
jgi:hypothetical protein